MALGAGWIAGLSTGGALVLAGGISAAFHWRFGPRVRRAVVRKFNLESGITVTEEMLPWLAPRLRRRSLASIIAVVPLAALVMGWYVGEIAATFGSSQLFGGWPFGWIPEPGSGPFFMLMFFPVIYIGLVLGDAYDYLQGRRERGSAVTGEFAVQLRDAIPSVLVWITRVLALAPTLIGMAILALPTPDPAGMTARGHLWLYLLMAAGTLAVVAGIEWLQRAILRGVESGQASMELAVERDLRAGSVLRLWGVACAADFLAVAVVAAPLLAHPVDGTSAKVAALMWVPAALIGIFMTLIVPQRRWARRYYQRRYPAAANG